MKDGGTVLAALRSKPSMAIAAWGFIVRGEPLADGQGQGCTLTCTRYGNSSIYQIAVARGGTDWYIPFHFGEARYCDVPRGETDGTLVVTFPMNGCALEVRRINGDNRFYHDSDGNSMPNDPPGVRSIRVTAPDYEGPDRTAHFRALRYFSAEVQNQLEVPNRGGYEHTVLCVKQGSQWKVYGSTNIRLNFDAWQIKDRVPYHLGTFDD